jgi:predicted dehydrogenase
MKNFSRFVPRAVKRLAHQVAMKLSGVLPLPAMEADRVALAALDPTRPLRCGVIGLGTMGRTHADVLRRWPHFKLVGITSRTPDKRATATGLGCRWFDSAEQMIHSGEIDVAVIATPHWGHAEIAAAALRGGLHVVCEKPLAVTVAQADGVLRAAAEGRTHLTVVFQTRYEPAYRYAKALLSTGELGPFLRGEMVETTFRSEAYYRSGPWRGTWKGEGGGVLVNQAPHVLDRYAWLCGMPSEVAAFCDTALHKIEVEDTVSAVFRHGGGAQGHVHVSTNECPAVSRVVIACERGRITIDHGAVRVDRLEQSVRDRARDGLAAFGDVSSRAEKRAGAPAAWSEKLLEMFYDDFALAVAGTRTPPVSVKDGARAVELANAIMLSSASGRALQLPLDRGSFETFLAGKVESRPAPEDR